jgi:hypothetical protein
MFAIVTHFSQVLYLRRRLEPTRKELHSVRVEVNDSGKHSSLLQNYGCKRVYRTGPWEFKKTFFSKESLLMGKSSVQLTTLFQLVQISCFCNCKHYLLFYQTSYLNEGVNRNETVPFH